MTTRCNSTLDVQNPYRVHPEPRYPSILVVEVGDAIFTDSIIGSRDLGSPANSATSAIERANITTTVQDTRLRTACIAIAPRRKYVEERLAEKFSTTMAGLVPADRRARAIVQIRSNPSPAVGTFRIVLIAGAIHQLISSLDMPLGARTVRFTCGSRPCGC